MIYFNSNVLILIRNLKPKYSKFAIDILLGEKGDQS